MTKNGQDSLPIVVKHFFRAIATLLLLWLAFFVYQTLPRLSYTFALDACEPFSLNRSLAFAQNLTVYGEIDSYPFFLANYPPVYEWLVSFFLDPAHPSFFAGRLVSYISQLLLFPLVALMIYLQTRKVLPSLIGGGVIFLTASAWIWCGYHRVDILGLLFSTLGLALFASLKGRQRLWAIPLFLLAGYTKQTFIAAPLAAFLWSRQKEDGHPWLFASLYGTGGIAIFALATYLTGGGFFYHTVYYNFTPVSFHRTIDMSLRPLGKAFGIWIIIGAAMWKMKKEDQFSLHLFHYYALVAYAMIVLTGGKLGSSWNYFLELGVVMGLLLGEALAWLEDHPSRQWLAIFVVLFAIQLGYSAWVLPERDQRIWNRARAYEPHRKELMKILKEKTGPLLVENVQGETKMPAVDVVVLSSRVISLNIHYYLMIQGGLWSPEPLEKEVASKRFVLVILNRRLKPPDWERTPRFRTLLKKYRFWRSVGPFVLYQRR